MTPERQKFVCSNQGKKRGPDNDPGLADIFPAFLSGRIMVQFIFYNMGATGVD